MFGMLGMLLSTTSGKTSTGVNLNVNILMAIWMGKYQFDNSHVIKTIILLINTFVFWEDCYDDWVDGKFRCKSDDWARELSVSVWSPIVKSSRFTDAKAKFVKQTSSQKTE